MDDVSVRKMDEFVLDLEKAKTAAFVHCTGVRWPKKLRNSVTVVGKAMFTSAFTR